MSSTDKLKLKEDGICRIFFSSPFTGMEEERDALTKRFWPRIQSLCNSKGIQFRAVDMRWGITAQSAEAARVIDICLRECTRSDIFVGFYGQRYGWHGADDPALQKNFDNAKRRFPWIDEYRDRSMTELEFIQGHLKNPGLMPACICFRDESYDAIEYEKLISENNEAKAKAFIAESDFSRQKMTELKKRVLETEKSTLGVQMNYKSPRDAAEFMFQCIWDYLNRTLGTGESNLTSRELALAQHKAFAATRSKLFIGRETFVQELLDTEVNTVITGESGCGKSALIANWCKILENDNNFKKILIVHHIGCGSNTTSIEDIVDRINTEIVLAMELRGYNDIDKESLKKATDVKDKLREMRKLLKSISEKKDDCLIVLDGLEKIDKSTHKIFAPLYWLPENDIEHIQFILSTISVEKNDIDELLKRKYKNISLPLLDRDKKEELCITLLKENSKDMTEIQLKQLLDIDQTNNPLFLQILIEELCAFGSFRKLDTKIKELTSTENIRELFAQTIERFINDYNDSEYIGGDFVKKTLCGLTLSKYGLTENDLISYLNIQQHIWSPFYYALEKYLLKRGASLQLAHNEMIDVIEEHYLKVEKDRADEIKALAQFFFAIFQERIKRREKLSITLINEMPELLFKSSMMDELLEFMTNFQVIKHFEEKNHYELLSYMTKFPNKQIVSAFSDSMNTFACDIYMKCYKNYDTLDGNIPSKIFYLYDAVYNICDRGKLYSLCELALRNGIRIIDYCKIKSEQWRSDTKYLYKHRLGCLLSDLMRFEESLKIHEEVLDWRKSNGDKGDIQSGYHSIGTLYLHDQQYEKAMEYFKEASKLQNDIKIEMENGKVFDSGFCNKNAFAATHTNIGLVLLRQNNLAEAEVELLEALKLNSEYYFGEQTLDIAYTYHNLAMIHRRRKQYDKAEEYYLKSLSIKVKYLGERTYDVGLTYMNLGTLELARNSKVKFFEYSEKCLDILSEVIPDEEHQQIMMAKENYAHGLFLMGRKEEAEKVFWETIVVHEKRDDFQKGLLVLYKEMLNMLKDREDYEKCLRVLLPVMKTTHLRSYHFVILKEIQKKFNVQLPDNEIYKIEYGFKKFPKDSSILECVGNELIEKNDFDELCKLCNLWCDIQKIENPGKNTLSHTAYCMFGLILIERNIDNCDKCIQLIDMGLSLVQHPMLFVVKCHCFIKKKQYAEASEHVNLFKNEFMERNEKHDALDSISEILEMQFDDSEKENEAFVDFQLKLINTRKELMDTDKPVDNIPV